MSDPTRTRPALAQVLAVIVAALPAAGLAQQAQKAAEPAAPPPPAGAPAPQPPATPPAPEPRRVVYIPESVKEELKKEIREALVEEARREGLKDPSSPDWPRRLRLGGDVRARYDRSMFGAANASTGDFPDFAAINGNRAFDMNGVDVGADRYLNVDQARNRTRLRARFGVDADLGGDFSAAFALASGDGSSPVSTNQTLGGFSKYQVWIDRASIRWAPGSDEGRVTAEVGHFRNPFLRTDLTWDDDVNLDGAAVSADVRIGGGLKPFLVGGAFPVFHTGFAFAAERPEKFESIDKWLFAGQLGTAWTPRPGLALRVGAAYYHYVNVEGELSGPCDTHLRDVSCDTDHTRPAFAQKGNTYRTLRTPSQAALAAEASGLASRYQFFGLVTPFQIVTGTARLDVALGKPLKVSIEGEYAQNLAFSQADMDPVALNNRGPQTCDENGVCADSFEGGDRGYKAAVTFASASQEERWSWYAGVLYRYLESDAVLDAFTDSDFGLGGTNLEGYGVTAGLAVQPGVWIAGRWFSADGIAGATYEADVLLVDFSARF